MVEIGFDLRRLPNQLSMVMVDTSIVDCMDAAERSPIELDVRAGRVTNSMGCCIDCVIERVVLVACWQSKCHQKMQPYSLVALRFVAPTSSYKLSCVQKKEIVVVCIGHKNIVAFVKSSLLTQYHPR